MGSWVNSPSYANCDMLLKKTHLVFLCVCFHSSSDVDPVKKKKRENKAFDVIPCYMRWLYTNQMRGCSKGEG